MTRPPSRMPRPNRIGAFAVQRFVVPAAAGLVVSPAPSVVVLVVVSVIGSPRGVVRAPWVGARRPRFACRDAIRQAFATLPPGRFRRTSSIGGEVRRYVPSAHAPVA